MTLAGFLAARAAVPFSRGAGDCCILVADWVLDQTGIDPAAGLRGYSDDRGAMLRIGRAGGFEELARQALGETAGLEETELPQPGDVGLVEAGGCLTLAIKTSSGWACKENDGLAILPATVRCAWRVV